MAEQDVGSGSIVADFLKEIPWDMRVSMFEWSRDLATTVMGARVARLITSIGVDRENL